MPATRTGPEDAGRGELLAEASQPLIATGIYAKFRGVAWIKIPIRKQNIDMTTYE